MEEVLHYFYFYNFFVVSLPIFSIRLRLAYYIYIQPNLIREHKDAGARQYGLPSSAAIAYTDAAIEKLLGEVIKGVLLAEETPLSNRTVRRRARVSGSLVSRYRFIAVRARSICRKSR